MKVTVFGIGYVGLVQGTVLASVGHDVVCVDIDESKVKSLNEGIVSIFEPGLERLVKENIHAKRLSFTTNAKVGVAHGEIQFIAVGTPSDEDGSADLQYVLSVAETIATHMNGNKTIVNKSTVPVGTASRVKDVIQSILLNRQKTLDFHVVSNPEFLKEGAAVSDCQSPDRIIIGTDSKTAEQEMRALYAPFNRNHEKIMVMDCRSAELTKYAANCMLATKISFMNEIANIAEIVGADIESVRQGIGSDPRIGYHFIYPGCGYGGSCFPKDIKALINTATSHGYESKILSSVEAVNEQQKNKLFCLLSKYFDGDLKDKTIAVWGLSYKPNTDDMRQAPSVNLLESLFESGATVQAYDPAAMEACQKVFVKQDDLVMVDTKEAALKNADALVICTDWNQFKAPDFDLLKNELSFPLIIDGRNLYDPKSMKGMGFAYFAVGRGDSVFRI